MAALFHKLVSIFRSFVAYISVSLWVLLLAPGGMLLALMLRSPNILYLLGRGGVRLGLATAGINVQVDGSTSTYYEGQPVLNKNGLMSFFSANTFHWTDRYEGNDERITIAFDIYNKEFYEHTVPSFFNKHHWVKI